MSLGLRAYWASGERPRGLCSTAYPANDVERGCSLAFVLLVDPLALDGGAREAAPLPLALRLAFDGGGDGHRLAALDLPLRRRLLVEWRVHERHVAGASPGCGVVDPEAHADVATAIPAAQGVVADVDELLVSEEEGPGDAIPEVDRVVGGSLGCLR